MTEQVLEGILEQQQHGERYFDSMEQALDFCKAISPIALSINLVNTLGGVYYQLIYQRAEEQ